MIRLLVADDHGIVRRGIEEIVSRSGDIVVAGEASTGEEALDLVRNDQFDIVILDISMPGRGGLDVIKDLRAAKPGLKVIILSMYSEEQYAVRSLRDGASAFLTKTSAEGELVEAIHAVAGGPPLHYRRGGREPGVLRRVRIRAPTPRTIVQT